MTFQLVYKEAGDRLDGVDIRENIGFVIVTSINLALDGATTTNQDNLDIDLFGADTASTKTNLTYDGGTDRYDCDAGQDYCTLISAVNTITTSETVVVVKALITKESGTVVTTSVSFDNGGNWTAVTEKELAEITNTGTQMLIKWYFDRTANNTGTDYIEGYGAYYG